MVIAVFGSGVDPSPYARAAGKAIAVSGNDLLTGGGGGAMSSALEGFQEVGDRRGISYAILPRAQYQPSDYDHVIRTAFDAPKDLGQSPFSRNVVNVAFCHGCVFVSDTLGTLTEVVWMQRLGKPSVFFGPAQTWTAAEDQLKSEGADSDLLIETAELDEHLESVATQAVSRLLQVLAGLGVA